MNNRATLSMALAAVLAVFSSTAALATAGHGGGKASQFGQPGRKPDVSRMIERRMGEMWFEPSVIEATPGKTIRFVVRNEGTTRERGQGGA